MTRLTRDERRFLARSLLLYAPRDSLRGLVPRVRWGVILEVARRNAVLATVYRTLADLGLHELLGDELRRAVQEHAAAIAAFNGLALVELHGLQRSLGRSGIESVALKGTALAAAHYPSYAAREFGDIDLLVRPAALARAARVVEDAGYRVSSDDDLAVDGTEESLTHMTPFRGPGGITLELHRRAPLLDDRETERLMARSRLVSWQGRQLRIPSGPDLHVVGALHDLRQHGDQERYAVRHVADAHVLEATGAAARDVSEASTCSTHARRALATSRRMLRAATGAGTLPSLLGDRSSAVSRIRRVRARVTGRLYDGLPTWRYVIPARRFMAHQYGLSSEAAVSPLLYAHRLWRGFVRLLRR